jgi:hypothetical protein
MANLIIGSTPRGKFALPDNASTQALAFLGRRGSGKTYGATKLAELMYAAGSQFVAIDPVGVWWGLRNGPDGKGVGLKDVVIFGGLHGDMPLLPHAGELVADLIVERAISAVLDVSQFEADSERARFAKDFAARFFHRKKTLISPVHVFVEEAQEFIPQNIQKGEEQMLHAWQRMIRLGRNLGIGVTMISQRPQDVNKKALNQAECVFAFQLTGLQERRAVGDWISDKGLDGKLADALPELRQGHAHVWSPVWLRVNEEVTIGSKTTYAAGSTPTADSKPIETKPLAAADFEKLTASMSKVIEESKANDPRELKKKIADLERKLKTQPVPQASGHSDKAVQALIAKALSDRDREWKGLVNDAAGKVVDVAKSVALLRPGALPAQTPQSLQQTSQTSTTHRTSPVRSVARPMSTGPSDSSLGRCERAILAALAQHGDSSKNRAGILAGYSPTSGGFNNSLSKLRSAGYVKGGGESLSITNAGSEALGEYEPLPTGDDLHNYWYNKLSKSEAAILKVLVEARSELTKDQIGEATGYSSTSGGFNNSLSRLRTLELIEGYGQIKASDSLF